MKKYMNTNLVFLGLFLILSNQVFGTDYYVDRNNGSNITGNGTKNLPWETISFGLSQINSSGHTVHIAPGIYDNTPSGEGWSEIFPIQLKNRVSLLGSETDTTIIDAVGTAYAFLFKNISDSTTSIENCLIKGGNPAGIRCENSNGRICSCVIVGNTQMGVSISQSSFNYLFRITNVQINDNGETKSNGDTYAYGIQCSGGTLIINNNSIKNNSANASWLNHAYTYGIKTSNGNLLAINNIIENNTGYGGWSNVYGIYCTNCLKVEIYQNKIKMNKDTGSGFPIAYGIIAGSDSTIIIENEVESNYSDWGGAGISCNGKSVRVDSNLIKKNRDGVYFNTDYSIIRNNKIIENNLTGIVGSSKQMSLIYKNVVDSNDASGIILNSGKVTLTNNVIYSNNDYGLKLSNNDSTFVFNNTIDANKGGIYITKKGPNIINNIISNNIGYGIYEAGEEADPDTCTYNLFFNNTNVYYDEGQFVYPNLLMTETFVKECTNNLEGDPLFVDSQIEDFHLLPGSPAIDAGDPSFDFSNEPQPNGGRIDIGAYGNTPEATPSGVDPTGPRISNLSVSPNPTSGASSITLNALVSDVGYGNSAINEAEYFIDNTGLNGTGTFLSASDGAFDELTENVQTIIHITSWQVGSSHKIYVHGKDIHNNWGDFDSVAVLVTSSVPRELSIPNKSASPGDIVVISAFVDSAAGIAGAEIKVTYDSNILIALEALTTTLTKDFTIADSIMTGKLAITMACSTGLSGGNGQFVNIKFQVSGSASIGATSPLHFELAALYDENTNPIPVTTQDGIFTVVPDTVGEILRIFIKPPSDTLNISNTREFSAFGKRSDSSEVSVSVNWVLENKFGNIGGINPGSGEKTTFTVTGPGDGLLKATYNGTLTATAVLVVGKLKGDINIDNKVNVQDAIRCLQIIVKNYAPSLYQLWSADFDGSGGWPDEGDALGILKESLKGLLPKVMVYNTSGTATVSMGSLIYESDDIISVPILIEGRDDVFASGFEIHYNSQVLMVLAATSAMPSSYLATNFNEPGTAKISLINTHGLVNSQEEIITLKFKVNGKQDGDFEVNIKQARLFDRQAQRIEANVNQDQEMITALPTAYELNQNYPNPFNPTTTIRYDLPEASEIKLIIYNMTGQEIKTLATGKVAAGSHSIVWDGRDNAGRAVPSGVYFYKLSVESQQWQRIKKMVLIK